MNLILIMTACMVMMVLLCSFAQAEKSPSSKSKASQLQAGPVRMELLDGELRYLCVGDKEIVRRIYFAVRDGSWSTAPAKFTKMNVTEDACGGFVVEMAAKSINANAGFDWVGKITGNARGEITFSVSGVTLRDFDSPRIGLCVLVGSDAMAGKGYEAVDAAGAIEKGTFPKLISPKLLQPAFKTLRYTVSKDSGLGVEMSLDATEFNMEDQRSYGDTSYKAYAAMDFSYPKIKKNTKAKQTLALRISSTNKEKSHQEISTSTISIDDKKLSAKVPAISLKPAIKSRDFGELNSKGKELSDATCITWPICPTIHLADDDTIMENIPAIVDQAQTIRSFAPKAKLAISSASISSSGDHDEQNTQNARPIEAVWAAGMVQYASIAGISEISFNVDTSPAEDVLKDLSRYAGKNLASISIKATTPMPIDAFAIIDGDKIIIWAYNKTNKITRVRIAPGAAAALTVTRLADKKSKPETHASTKSKSVEIEILPHSLVKIGVVENAG